MWEIFMCEVDRGKKEMIRLNNHKAVKGGEIELYEKIAKRRTA